MYQAAYDRLHPPEDINNQDFGDVCAVARLSGNTASKAILGKARNLPSLDCPPSKVYGYDTQPTQLSKCRAKFFAGYSKEINATTFLPDQGVVVNTDQQHLIVEETLWHGTLFFMPWFRNDSTTNWKWLSKFDFEPDTIITEPVNYCYHRFHTSYFHWFMDVMPHIWYMKNHSPYAEGRKWFCGPVDKPYKIESLKAFGIGEDDLLKLDGVVEFKNMAMSAFTFEEPLWTRPSFHNGIHHIGWSPDFTHGIREAMLRHFNIPKPRQKKRYYLSRADATHRRIVNEAEVLDILLNAGFEVIVPGELSFEDQVRTFADAHVLIGAHGAGFTNILWAPSGAHIVELMPERLADVGYRFTANMLKQKHYAIACAQFEHHFGDAFSDIEVDLNLLKEALRTIL